MPVVKMVMVHQNAFASGLALRTTLDTALLLSLLG
jgi:hypothetical protein